MDGSHIRRYLSQEVNALIATYKQFEALAKHSAEDGRYVEFLIRSCLKKFLPGGLDVSTGFILRPAVKTGIKGTERRGEKDQTSKQLDILVFDGARYSSFQRFDNAMIVPPEGVVGIISVKKTLKSTDIKKECESLLEAAELCRTFDVKDESRRGPFLALIGMEYSRKTKIPESIFEKISSAYNGSSKPFFDEVVGSVGVITEGSAYKARPSKSPKSARFAWHAHKKDDERHLALQFLIKGISSVYYDPTRSDLRHPGFTAFASGLSGSSESW